VIFALPVPLSNGVAFLSHIHNSLMENIVFEFIVEFKLKLFIDENYVRGEEEGIGVFFVPRAMNRV
jgi:hypothetical protein